jgi:hypothetical protein
MLNPISSSPQQNPYDAWSCQKKASSDDTNASGSRVSQTLRAVERTSAQDVNLQIQTDEGDTVTISLHNEVDLTAISYRYGLKRQSGSETMKLGAVSISSSQDLQVQVDGSLSDQELADVNALLDRIKAALPGLAGGTQTATPDGATSGDGSFESLAGYTLSIQRTESLTAVSIRLRTWQPAPAIQPAPQAIAIQPAAGEPDVGDSGATTVKSLEQATPAPVAPASQIDAVRKLLDAFQAVLESFRGDNSFSGASSSPASPFDWLSRALDQLRSALNGSGVASNPPVATDTQPASTTI